jgi:hypothetical protein
MLPVVLSEAALEFGASISPEGRSAAERWAKTRSYPGPREFERKDAMEMLQYPWEDWREPPVVIEEEAGCGLWATQRFETRAFTKTGGKWDLPTVVARELGALKGIANEVRHQGVVASRIEELGMAEGTTLEVLNLGSFGGDGKFVDGEGTTPASSSIRPLFHYANIAGRAMVPEHQERQDLVEALARAILGVSEDPSGHYMDPAGPGFGIILTRGDEEIEFEIWPEGGLGFVFGDGVDKCDRDETERETTVLVSPARRTPWLPFSRVKGWRLRGPSQRGSDLPCPRHGSRRLLAGPVFDAVVTFGSTI